MQERRRQIVKLAIMIVLTLSFFVAEITGGYMTGSLALVSDSYHMISDVLALVIGLSCLIISTRSSKHNTFGWARAEILGALVNSVFLTALCFTILLEAIERLVKPQQIKEPYALLLIGVLGLLVNLLGLLLFCNETHAHSHLSNHNNHNNHNCRNNCHSNPGVHSVESCESVVTTRCERSEMDDQSAEEKSTTDQTGKLTKGFSNNSNASIMKHIDPEETAMETDMFNTAPMQRPSSLHDVSAGQMNIRGVFLHLLGDALGSVVVIVSALVLLYCRGPWVLWVDPVLSILLVVIILSTTYPLLKQSALTLMQHVPQHIRVSELSMRLSKEIEGILGIHELHIWQLVGRKMIASLHVKCRSAQEYQVLSVKIKEFLHNEGIHSTTIQPEFVEIHNEQSEELERCSMQCEPAKTCQKHWCCSHPTNNHHSTLESNA